MADPQKQDEDAEQRAAPPGAVVYKAIRHEGEDELQRPTSALAWSGLAAGLSMGFSFLVQAMLHSHLPDTEWRPLVSSLGYSVGFLIVILGRQQLFTENTLTVILPLLLRRDKATFRNVVRLWTVVLLANLVGALLFAFVLERTSLLDDPVKRALVQTAEAAFNNEFWVTVLRGIFAGWLIAMMVWLLPFAEAARVWVIIIVTYIVGLANFSHVIAGSVEAGGGVVRVQPATAAPISNNTAVIMTPRLMVSVMTEPPVASIYWRGRRRGPSGFRRFPPCKSLHMRRPSESWHFPHQRPRA